LRNWKFLRFCKQGNKQGSFASGHKSGESGFGVSLGTLCHPKNGRDLTFQPFVGIMGADQSSCFMLSGGIVKGECWLEFGNLWGSQFFPGFICRQGQLLVIASGGKFVC
jgi:hypothetical protein